LSSAGSDEAKRRRWIGARQVQRLDAQTVAGDEQLLRIALPDGEGEHAVQPR